MIKKITIIVLAGITLLTAAGISYASRYERSDSGRKDESHRNIGHRDSGPRDSSHRDGGRRDEHHGGRVIIVPPRISPVFCFPPRRLIISPTFVLGGSSTVVETRFVREVVREETIVVWVNNDNGSKTEVRLTKTNDGGYIGPRGEYYSRMPKQEQLEAMYAVRSRYVVPSNITVWITNDNGSQTPVTLTPSGVGFIGPSGEYYPTMPMEEQLKALYGLRSNTQGESSITIWLDSETPIVLIKDGPDYIGPKGEHYADIPTKEQLKMIYGDKPKKIDTSGIIIWLKNADGSRTPITLHREGWNYIGPAGEKYTSLPTEQELKLLYGSDENDEQCELSFEITKDDGSKTIVVLKKEGSEFVGPNGERYQRIPTEEQLKLVYGK